MREGVEYNGEVNSKNKGRAVIIKPRSIKEQIIADWMESGLGLENTTLMVNTHRQEVGLGEVTVVAIYSAYRWMLPEVTKLEAQPQGNKDEDSVWAKTRFEWT